MSGVVLQNAPEVTAPEARLFGLRTRLVLVTSTLYVGAAALRAAEGRGALAWVCAVAAIGVAWSAGMQERWTSLGSWGMALAMASLGAPDAGGWVGVLGIAGGFAAAVAARVTIARVSAPEGIAHLRSARPLVGLSLLGALAALGLGAHLAQACGAHGWFASDVVGFGLAASTGAFAVLVASAWNASIVRKLELGVAARMHAAAGLAGATAGIGLALWFLGLGGAEPLARFTLAAGAVLVCRVTQRGDPVDLARASRRAIALMVVGGPILLLGAGIAEGRPWDSPTVVGIFGTIALMIGAAAEWIEEPLRPARGAWLDAVAAAHEALLRTDPDEAVREALVALRAPAGLDAASPELWTFDPMRVTRVDAAGYVHGGQQGSASVSIPDGLVATAAREPEAILRHEVLEEFQVRRAELRPYARWMDDRGAMLVAVITRAGEAEGLLVLPRGRRATALSLEEARAIKRLADALAALCHARASLARSLDRERAAQVAAEQAQALLAHATGELERRGGAHTLATERLARPATVGIYSAAARMTFDAIEATLRGGRTLFVHAPPGTDPVPYVARAHLATPRRTEPLVVVDGTSTREHDPARWRDPSLSPLALAARGLLLLVDGPALPLDIQRVVAQAHELQRAPWDTDEGRLGFAMAMTATTPLANLAESGRVELSLASRFPDAATCALPRLRDRPEDLRAIVSDRLAREGLRARGVPVGIEDAAFARLLDYPFEGEDAELAAMVQRLVTACTGDVIRARDVDAILALQRDDVRPSAVASAP
jgi:hypothetical protein